MYIIPIGFWETNGHYQGWSSTAFAPCTTICSSLDRIRSSYRHSYGSKQLYCRWSLYMYRPATRADFIRIDWFLFRRIWQNMFIFCLECRMGIFVFSLFVRCKIRYRFSLSCTHFCIRFQRQVHLFY